MADVQVGDVLVSPDGTSEITTSSPAQIVELRFDGWTPKNRRPERRQRRADVKPSGHAAEQTAAGIAPRPVTHPDDAT